MTDKQVKTDHRSSCAISILLGACLLFSTAYAQDNFEITLRDGLVEMQADDADLRQLLGQLAEQAGFKLWISEKLQPQPVKAALASRPLKQTLAQLLQDYGHALVYSDDGEVSALYVLPPGDEQPAMVELTPANETHRVIEQMLAAESIPENIKSALLQQSLNNNEAQQQSILGQRTQALTQIIEQLEKVGAASSETMLKLREKLRQESVQ